MTVYKFEEVAVRGTRKVKDGSGKTRQQTKKFSQTINPYNKNDAGSVKTREEIMREITAERDAWMAS